MSNQSKGHGFDPCCEELKRCMNMPDSFFFLMDEILFMAVGVVKTEQGNGFFDHAVLFCPFCGTRLQTTEEVALKASIAEKARSQSH